MALKRIMVALGGSEYMDVAMEAACSIVKRHGGEVHGVALRDETLVDPHEATPIGGGAAAADARGDREESVAFGIHDAILRFESLCEEEGIAHTIAELSGDAVETLAEELRLMDLGIFGIRHAFDYGAVAHDDDFLARVAKASRRPILAMPKSARPIRRIVVAYDGSIPAADALRSFAVLHAFDVEHVRIVASDDHGLDAAAAIAEASAYLKAHGMPHDGSVLTGAAAPAILDHASGYNADLIVLGAVGRRGFLKLVMGDTATAVLADSSVPLFLSA